MAGRLFAPESVTEGHPDTIAGQISDTVLGLAEDGIEPGPGGCRLPADPAGRFEAGGPVRDAGPAGRRTVFDTYGGTARRGGGVFRDKDPSTADRSAAYAVRDLGLLRPVHAQTAAYGRRRELPGFTWESTDRADALRHAVGVPATSF